MAFSLSARTVSCLFSLLRIRAHSVILFRTLQPRGTLSSRLRENYSQIIRVIDPDNKFRTEESISEFISNDRRSISPRALSAESGEEIIFRAIVFSLM